MRLFITLITIFLMPTLVLAEKSPCNYKPEAGDCLFAEGGWKQVAVQHYDAQSDYNSLWEKNGEHLICNEPSDSSRQIRCTPYGGDIKAFKEDAIKEAVAREKWDLENKARQEAALKQHMEGRSCHPACGEDFIKNGWKEVKRYGGHQWFYLLQKDNKHLLCSGINGVAGPFEEPCVSFTGGVKSFKEQYKKYD